MKAVRAMRWGLVLLLLIMSCAHDRSIPTGEHTVQQGAHAAPDTDVEEGIRVKGNSVAARIWALIGRGQFAEAEALLGEATASGLVSKQVAEQMTRRIALLNTRLGDIPSSLQRAPNFPSQLKDFTLFEIKQMLESRDFSLATEAQLNMAKKLIQEQLRLMAD